jgi:hypothetical protein
MNSKIDFALSLTLAQHPGEQQQVNVYTHFLPAKPQKILLQEAGIKPELLWGRSGKRMFYGSLTKEQIVQLTSYSWVSSVSKGTAVIKPLIQFPSNS